MPKIKLTERQKEIVKLLQGGEVLITNEREAGVSKGKKYVRISLVVFWNLEHKGLIYQNARNHHNWELTDLGRTINLD